MALGPGKYDRFCTDVRQQTHAAGVLLVVLNGGPRQRLLVPGRRAPERLPELLENLAAQIRRDGPFLPSA